VIAGTKLKYMPGVIQGGKGLEHDCGVHRGIGYFLEPLILLGLFAKAPISIRLKGEASLVCASVFTKCWARWSALRNLVTEGKEIRMISL